MLPLPLDASAVGGVVPLPIDLPLLQAILEYDSLTGVLTWKVRDPETFECRLQRSQEQMAKQFNTRWAGRPAFTTLCGRKGYLQGAINNRKYLAHRICWALGNAAEPRGQVDHINGDRKDNRLINRRDVPATLNCRNIRMSPLNTTGRVGIMLRPSGKWSALIPPGIGGGRRCLGTWDTKAEAIAARQAAERLLGYHENHGKPRP